MKNSKWLKITGLALSLPSTIFGSAYLSMKLVEENIISKFWGVIIFLLIVCNLIYLMVWYAYKNKDRS